MAKIFLILAVTTIALVKINAQTMCSVGESEAQPGGQCNDDNGDNKCKEYCTKRYGAELLKATCSAARENGQRECICSLKCANGGCWGDPHCWSFDGTTFGYQSLKKYYVLKPCKAFPSLPEFEIMQINRPWGAGPMAVMDTLEFVVAQWGFVLEVKLPTGAGVPHVFKVNKQVQNLPWRHSRQRGHREEFINVAFSDAQKLHLVIVTSFGLRITLSSKPTGQQGATSIYSDISVDIPRHPEMRGNTCGILGLWNDNPKDDNIDSHGKPQPLDPGFSHAFGDSWLVPGSGVPTECELELAKLAHDDHLKTISQEVKDKARALCKANLEQASMHACAKDIGRPAHEIDDCVEDLVHIDDEGARTAFLKAMVSKFVHHCPQHNITFKEPKSCDCLDLVPLYRFYNPTYDCHFYTTHYKESEKILLNNGYNQEPSPGRVAIRPADCTCNTKGFVPVHHLAGFGGKGGRPTNRCDHFYTASDEEAKNAIAKLEYVPSGVAFYCAPKPNQCGAKLEFHRYLRGSNAHFYTTSLEEAKKNVLPHGGKDEGVTCYIWPSLDLSALNDKRWW